MCLLLLALEAHPAYKLIIAANRDEFYERPTAPAGFWDERPHILAGRDLRAGGTWFGITRKGRIGAITNYRDPAALKSAAPSRGRLVTDFLTGDEEPEAYLTRLSVSAGDYNGFNLVVGVKDRLCWYSNRGHGIRRILPGVHGLSNHLLNTPWPKISRAKAALKDILSNDPVLSPEPLLGMLLDRSIPGDDTLPDTGVGIELERILSPIFIASPGYGTRSSTILLIDRQDRVTFLERTHNSRPDQHTDATFQFMAEG
ncbi:MAG: NRDE family protein [Candidatus Desulfacyla sp.]